MMNSSIPFNPSDTACFGVAGNFTGHLEQAGEASDFTNIKTNEVNAPKALFPTFIPNAKGAVPSFLGLFPFDSEKIIFPENEENIQIESECAVLFKAEWKEGKVVSLIPLSFCASNDVSIRKAGAKKISIKKNWGKSTKGLSANFIALDSFSKGGVLDNYRIASYMVREGKVFEYGENSPVSGYSYMYEKLVDWIIEKLNYQTDQGPAENVNLYLNEAGLPKNILVSIGATRYTEFGEHNFLKKGDKSVVVLYPENKYSPAQIEEFVKNSAFEDKDISALVQEVIL